MELTFHHKLTCNISSGSIFRGTVLIIENNLFVDLFIEGKYWNSPINRTGSPQGFSQIQILYTSHKKALNIQKTTHKKKQKNKSQHRKNIF